MNSTNASNAINIPSYDSDWQKIDQWIQPWRFNYKTEKDQFVGVIKFYNLARLDTNLNDSAKKSIQDGCYDIFIKLMENNYPIYEPDLICYAMVAEFTQAVDFLNNSPKYKYELKPWLPSYEDFCSLLLKTQTKSEAAKLINAYKLKNKIDRRIQNFVFVHSNRTYLAEVPFFDCASKQFPDFILEAFVANWDINEYFRTKRNQESTLHVLFENRRFRIVRLLLEADADTEDYFIHFGPHEEEDDHEPYKFIPPESFEIKTLEDRIDFAIYMLYVAKRYRANISGFPYAAAILQWFKDLRTFDLIVNRSKKEKSGITCVLNKDVLLVIRSFLLSYNL